jgi:hypothetical protein
MDSKYNKYEKPMLVRVLLSALMTGGMLLMGFLLLPPFFRVYKNEGGLLNFFVLTVLAVLIIIFWVLINLKLSKKLNLS